MPNAKTVLFIDNSEAELLELNTAAKEFVSADDNVYGSIR